MLISIIYSFYYLIKLYGYRDAYLNGYTKGDWDIIFFWNLKVDAGDRDGWERVRVGSFYVI